MSQRIDTIARVQSAGRETDRSTHVFLMHDNSSGLN